MRATGDTKRHDALLNRVAREMARLDGSLPGGALIGPRVLFLGAFNRLPDERLVTLGTSVELLRRATLTHREPRSEQESPATGRLRLSRTLVGDSLLAASFRLLAADGDPRTVGLLSRAMAEVSEGELERTADGGGVRRRAAYAVGAAEVSIVLCGIEGPEALALLRTAAAVGEAQERGGPAPAPSECGFPDAGRRWLHEALMARVGAPDVVMSERAGQPL